MDIKERVEKGEVHAIFIIEVAGRPPEHIEKALKILVEHLEKQKDVEVIIKKFHKPEPVQNLFSSFCEIELIVENFSRLLSLIFNYMPSSIEIIEPKHFKFSLADANAIINDLSSRLHQYDAIAKRVQIEKAILVKKFEEKIKEKQLGQPQPEKIKKLKKQKKKPKKKIKKKRKTK